jgi:predicted RNase H-like nuclease
VDFVGVDLAWTSRGGTGVCHVVDGRVVASDRLSADGEIVDWVARAAPGDAVVAIDAPLIVRNVTGRRPCEQLISRCFGAYHAAAHSANLAQTAFREGVRGERLAAELGLTVDPAFEPRTAVRRAIEVYPHPAIVALFDLPLTLKYKDKPGRTLAMRVAALTELVRHLESLAGAEPRLDVRTAPRWARLAATAAQPASGRELARIEDELDAFVCAYVGLYYWTHGSERCRVVGDVDEGYIVTPVNEAQARCLDGDAARPRAASAVTVFSRWLQTEGWTIEPDAPHADLKARRGEEILYVELKGLTARSHGEVDALYGRLLGRMREDEPSARYAVVVPEAARAAALRVPAHVRTQLRIDVYVVGAGGVQEV